MRNLRSLTPVQPAMQKPKPDRSHLRGTARNMNQYPDSFRMLADSFEGPTPMKRVIWECESESQAKHTRFRLYAFKRTLERCGAVEDYPNFMWTRIRVKGCQIIIEDVNAMEVKIISAERGTPAAPAAS